MMKKILFVILILFGVIKGCSLLCAKTATPNYNITQQALNFCKKNNYNTDFCFLVDFSQSTQVKRFIVFDFNKQKVIYSCYCAHGNDGSGNNGSNGKNQATVQSFSNKIGSHKSSLGKYRVGKRRTINSVDGMFDVSMYNIPCYEMHGLETSNSNAHKRGILIHPMPSMDSNWLMTPPGMSFGCFSIGIKAFGKISGYISNSSKPILLWAYF